MIICFSLFIFSLFIPIQHLTILSWTAIAVGLCSFFAGICLLVRQRLPSATAISDIRSDVQGLTGLTAVSGVAAGPYTVTAPITGKRCFLYHAAAWQQSEQSDREWKKVADETLHLPFFIDDSTGQLLIEPLGADLDLNSEFCEEYGSFFSSTADNMPLRVSDFLSCRGVVLSGRVRVEESFIEPEDALFVAGTITENPGVQVRPLSPSSKTGPNGTSNQSPNTLPVPQIIRLQSGVAPASAQEMSQQGKIAAALTRAGITKPEAWSAAGVPYRGVAVEENKPAPFSAQGEVGLREPGQQEDESEPSNFDRAPFDLTPPLVMMKGANDSRFVISFRSPQELFDAPGWKPYAMICAGAATTLLGIYVVLLQMGLL